jgi:hypothetical protein
MEIAFVDGVFGDFGQVGGIDTVVLGCICEK